jgi:AraC-like DNA-binding protein
MLGQDWLDTLAGRCQQVAGRASELHEGALPDGVRTLVTGLPANLTMAERLATRNWVTTLLARVMRSGGIDRRRDVLTIFFDWAACDITSPAWCADIRRFVDSCAAAFQHDPADTPEAPVADARIAAAVRAIESGYRDPELSLDCVASQSGLSLWHAARLLKRLTGSGFTTHLHRVRIAAARKLLDMDEQTLCIKEIAAAVGYSSSSQFSCRFKRLVGSTPTQYRVDVSVRG